MAIIGISGKLQSGKNTVGVIIQYISWCKLNSIIENKEHYTLFYNKQNYDKNVSSGWTQKAFASKLKQCVSIITGIPVEDLEKEKVKNKVLGKEWNNTKFIPGLGLTEDKTVDFVLTVRQLLQQLGTEVGRSIHSNFWVNALFREYKPLVYSRTNRDYLQINGKQEDVGAAFNDGSEYPNWIITDVRFPNELQAIKDKGGIVIRVNKYMETNNTIWGKDSGIFDNLAHSSETALDNATFDYTVSAKQGDIESLITQVKEILIKEKII